MKKFMDTVKEVVEEIKKAIDVCTAISRYQKYARLAKKDETDYGN